MKRITSLFILLALPLLFAATINVTAAPRVESDIAYLPPDRTEKLDAYLPDPAVWPGPHPAVLFIHGGGWHGGDKANARERNIGENLSAAGYAVFSINYILNTREKDPATGQFRTTRFVWPQNLYDCKSALRYLRANADRYNLNPDRIAVMGGSGGARLAQLLGATARHDEFNRHGHYTEQSNAISCILSFYGNYDIRGTHHFADGGLPPDETAAKQAEASAITYLDKNTPPMLIAHGTADKTAPVETSRLLAEHLRRLGVDYWYIEIAGAPHSFHLQPKQMDLRPTVLTFLAKHLGQPIPTAR
ncbi:alpha/beta hydrolase [Opitutaceae bacterium TAV4]|nr:alpha/beta hydrolase [Opitutaceae bacterium TAV3]RRK01377.1 alpha/beta hydrolase [Opitutaceae bacterium TAV4]